MKAIKNICLCGVLFLLTACATTYKDPRPFEEQESTLAAMKKKFSGNYDILERRGDGWISDMEGGTVRLDTSEGKVSVILKNQKHRSHNVKIQTSDCTGFESEDKNPSVLDCPLYGSTISSFLISQHKNTIEIKARTLIPFWKPMSISHDEYALEIVLRQNGHSVFYRLKKKE